jgi:CRP/FNR family transcriptional regulator, cyclic AMP receptor protein
MSYATNTQPELDQIWRRGEFYDSLRIEEHDDLERCTSCFSVPPGSTLFSEDEFPKRVFILLNGRAKLSVNLSDGKRFILRIAEPGEVLGLASALTGNPYEVTAETLYLCHIALIGREEFLEFLQRHPSALMSAARSLGNYYAQTSARFRTIGGTPTVATKLARLLLEFSASGEKTEHGTRLRLTLTHSEIGECIGMCRESVSRALCDFQRRKFIDLPGSTLTITDRSSLERCAST